MPYHDWYRSVGVMLSLILRESAEWREILEDDKTATMLDMTEDVITSHSRVKCSFKMIALCQFCRSYSS